MATDHVIESFRNGLWPGYKTGAGIEPDLLAQFPLLEDALSAAGVVVWPMVEFEADDALAAAAVAAARDARVDRVIICTPDKDLAQCVRGTRIVQLNRRTRVTARRGRRRSRSSACRRHRFPTTWRSSATRPTAIPGLPGWGAKSAAAVLARFGHLESIPEDWREWRVNAAKPSALAQTLARERDRALLFRTLATLRTDIALFDDVDQLRWTGPTPAFAALAARMDRAVTERPGRLCPLRLPAARNGLDGGAVPPRERHRLADGVFIDHIQPHGCAPLTSPCAALGRKRFRMFPDERLLLLRCQFDHSVLVIGMKRREDFSLEAEIGVPHVRAFDGILHPQRDSAEVVGGQHVFRGQCVSPGDRPGDRGSRLAPETGLKKTRHRIAEPGQ